MPFSALPHLTKGNFANIIVANEFVGGSYGLRKAGAIWVEGDRFYDRESELAALTERVGDGIHTLLTAQRRMGKTSLVRELLRRLSHEGRFETIFVDLEDVSMPEDAIAEIGARSMSVRRAPGSASSPGLPIRCGRSLIASTR